MWYFCSTFIQFEQSLRGEAELLNGKQLALVFQSQRPMLHFKLQLFSTVYHVSLSAPRVCSQGTVICVPSRSGCAVSSVNAPLADKLPPLLLKLVIRAIVILIMMLLKHDRWANCPYATTRNKKCQHVHFLLHICSWAEAISQFNWIVYWKMNQFSKQKLQKFKICHSSNGQIC